MISSSGFFNSLKEKESKISKDLYLPLLSKAANDSVFKNVEVDQYSFKLIQQGRPGQRYAVVLWVDEKENKAYLHCRPSAQEIGEHDPDDVKSLVQKNTAVTYETFKDNKEDVVKGPRVGVTGIVHSNTKKAVLKNYQTSEIPVYLTGKQCKQGGLSFTKRIRIFIILDKSINIKLSII